MSCCLLCRFDVQGQAATSQEVVQALSGQVFDGRLRKIEEVVFPSSRAVCVAGHYQQSRTLGIDPTSNPAGAYAALTEAAVSVYAVGVEGDRLITDPAACMLCF